MDDLVQKGITSKKAGKRDEARKYFIAAIKQNRNNEYAWQFMYNVANDDKERLSCLQQVLRINPQNEKAKSLLNQLKNEQVRPKNLISQINWGKVWKGIAQKVLVFLMVLFFSFGFVTALIVPPLGIVFFAAGLWILSQLANNPLLK